MMEGQCCPRWSWSDKIRTEKQFTLTLSRIVQSVVDSTFVSLSRSRWVLVNRRYISISTESKKVTVLFEVKVHISVEVGEPLVFCYTCISHDYLKNMNVGSMHKAVGNFKHGYLLRSFVRYHPTIIPIPIRNTLSCSEWHLQLWRPCSFKTSEESLTYAQSEHTSITLQLTTCAKSEHTYHSTVNLRTK